ncbi:MAG: acyltransferase [Deltaproteobacteria bacterium]|nr:acyltransferase [Deltaproteobacteria bacterium]
MTSPRIVRAALTETVNAFRDMPSSLAGISGLAGHLDEIRDANVSHHIDLLKAARGAGVQVVCFGELFTAPYFALSTDPLWLNLAEDAATGPTVTRLRESAREQGVVVIAPIYERAPSGRRFNTAVVISERGDVLGKYRKTHIPHGQNEQAAFREDFYYDQSDGENACGDANVSRNPYFPVFETSVGRIGVAICYDRHFEGVVSALACAGAELIFSPAVTFGAKSERMWPLEFAVDACRHRVFIGGSNRNGVEPPWNQPYFGKSHFVGPSGPIANTSTQPNLIIADLDLADLAGTDPSGWNLSRDARPEIYSSRG